MDPLRNILKLVINSKICNAIQVANSRDADLSTRMLMLIRVLPLSRAIKPGVSGRGSLSVQENF